MIATLLSAALLVGLSSAAATPRLHSTSVRLRDPTTGLRHHVDFDGELGPSTLVLSDLAGLQGTRCVDGGDVDTVHMTFMKPQQCSMALKQFSLETVFISGHNRQLRCQDYTHHRSAASMIDRVVVAPVCRGRVMTMKTEKGELHHVFKNAQLKVLSNAFLNQTRANELRAASRSLAVADEPRDLTSVATVISEGKTFEVDQKLDSGCLFCWVTKAYNAVVSSISGIAKTVEGAVESVWQGISPLPSGNGFIFNKDWQLASITKNWTLGFATPGSYAMVNCTSCGFSLALDLVVEATVTNFQITNFTAYLTGNADLVAEVLFQTNTFAFNSLNNELRLPTITLPPIEFSVGPLPVVVNTDIPLTAGWSLSAEAHAQVSTSARLTGNVQFGVQYSNKAWSYIHKLSWSQGGRIGDVAITGHGTGAVSFSPILVVQIDYVGGPALAIRASSDASVFYDLSNSCPTTHTTLSANIGVDSTVSANISISALGKNIINWSSPASTIFSKKWPIFSGCVSLPKKSLSSEEEEEKLDTSTSGGSASQGLGFPGFNVLGAVWQGNQTRIGNPTTCGSVPQYLDIFAQSVPDSNGNPELILTYSGDWPSSGGYCVSQLLYTAAVASNGAAVTLTPQTGTPVDFDQCAGGSPSSHRFSTTTLQVSSDYRVLSAQGTCFLFQLERRFSGE